MGLFVHFLTVKLPLHTFLRSLNIPEIRRPQQQISLQFCCSCVPAFNILKLRTLFCWGLDISETVLCTMNLSMFTFETTRIIFSFNSYNNLAEENLKEVISSSDDAVGCAKQKSFVSP